MIIYGCRTTKDSREASGPDRTFGIESVRHIFLRDCIPVVYEISDLSGLGAEVAVESLTLAFTRLEHDIGTTLEGTGAEQSATIQEMDRAYRADRAARGNPGSPTG